MKYVAMGLLLVAAIGAAIFALAGTADASHAKLEVVAPTQLTVGNSVDIRAVLHSADDGLAIAGTTVAFYVDSSFGGVDGEVMLGQAVTDEDGVALLSYQPRSAGDHQMRVEYLIPGSGEAEEATWSHTVTGATQQLYRSSAGVKVPGLNVWLLMALVATVWAILLSVAMRVVAIAHAGTEATSPQASTGRASAGLSVGRGRG